MRSSFLGLEVSKRSIQMAQKSLDIVNNNMGNIDTKGYTRQRIDTASLHISSYTYWQTRLSKLSLAGQGVTAFGVSQIRNAYLDKRYRDTVCYSAEYGAKIDVMKEVETALDNIDTFGLLAGFDQLKTALQKVSLTAPDAKDMCSLVRNEAVNICSMLRSYDADLNRLLKNNVEDLQVSIDNANNIIDKIVYYNKVISDEYASTDYGRVVSGKGVSEYGPLELLDQRNVLLDELASYGNIQVFQNANGSVRVTMGGTEIINDQEYLQIRMKNYDDYNAAVLYFSDGNSMSLTSGEIKAYADIVNGHGSYAVGRYQNSDFGIPYYIDALNAFAAEFANVMNTVSGLGREYNTYRFDTAFTSPITFTVSYGSRSETVSVTGATSAADVANAINAMFGAGTVEIDANGELKAVNDKVPFKMTSGDYTLRELTRIYYDPARRLITGADKTYDPNASPFANDAQDQNTGVTAANIRVSDAWIDNELLIGQVFNYNTGEWEIPNNLDGSNLQRFVMALEAGRDWGRARDFLDGTVFEYLQFLSNRMGQGIDFVENQLDAVMVTENELLNNRNAISTVSEDEEGVNMLGYQKWYNASARIMTALDECLDKVINGMGRCGL